MFTPQEAQLQKLFSAFPNGWPGIGLLLLRFALASCVLDHAFRTMTDPGGTSWTAWSFGVSAVLTGVALLVGFLTPVAGVLASLGYSIDGLSLLISANLDKHFGELSILNLFVMSLSLVLLGPGAFSMDARLFGRREIIIPDGGRSRHQRSEDSQ